MARVLAYGSNLCVERMLARAPSARVVATATLSGHALRWHKAGRDGSGKCDAFFTGRDADVVHGVVYEMDGKDKLVLDAFEGLGDHYTEKTVRARTADGGEIEATVYVALPSRIVAAAKPWTWYREHVATGARQHGLPAGYIAGIDAVDAAEDPDRGRHERETAEREGRTPRFT